ncbi:hypothetical protein AaE_014140 [Aphanomyces astaci]|uniref:Integrase catalytic domain-containing protein n=1 Tax=Aphanomyces astaci TaxID=112090 RepID=A0A6A4Z7U4_APHAT|nr:hypothetical protein AaE_014140 [Aphanomyces astaci]
MDSFLSQLYHDPASGYVSAYKLYKKAKSTNKDITLKQVKEWYKKQLDIQQHQTQVKQYPEFRITSRDPDVWQMDLMFVNKKPIFIAININSRIGYIELLKNKTAPVIEKALLKFIAVHNPSQLTSDNGSEFINKKVESMLKKIDIEHYNAEAGDHSVLGKIDRFIRTIKQRLTKIDQPLTQKLLNEVIQNYNDTYHSVLKATPNSMKGETIRADIDHNLKVMDDMAHLINTSVRYKLKSKTFGKEAAKYS